MSTQFDPIVYLNLVDANLCPPEPQLLDTCFLQNLDWVDRTIDGSSGGTVQWDAPAEKRLSEQYGAALAEDLLDLGTLYKEFENRGRYPWAVCTTAIQEAGGLSGPKGDRLRQVIEFFAGHQSDWADCAYPTVAKGALLEGHGRVSPLILRALGAKGPAEVVHPNEPLSVLCDRGDRLVAAHALFTNIPVILTTDRRTF